MKRKIDYELWYKVDEENRCVICWLHMSSFDFYNQIADFTGPVFKRNDIRLVDTSVPNGFEIKTFACAHEGDPWDPEGLKRLARKKALRKMNERLMKYYGRLAKDLADSWCFATEEAAKYRMRYDDLDEEITGSEFYEKWRETSGQS